MGFDIVIAIVLLAVGFGLGRIHNATKAEADVAAAASAAVTAAKKL